MPNIPYEDPMWRFNDKFMELHSCLASIINLFLLQKSTSKSCLMFQFDYAEIAFDQLP